MKIRYILILLVSLILIQAATSAQQPDPLTGELAKAESAADRIAACRNYIEKADDDAKELLIAKETWMQEDESGFKAFLAEKLKVEPESVKYLILNSRLQDSPKEILETARRIIALAPENQQGYVMLGMVYDPILGMPVRDDEETRWLKEQIESDARHFEKMLILKIESPDNPLLMFASRYLLYKGKPDDAIAYIEKSKSESTEGFFAWELARAWALKKDFGKAHEYTIKAVQSMIDDPNIPAPVKQQMMAERDKQIENCYAGILSYAKAYDEILKNTTTRPGYETNKDDLYNIACLYALKGDTDKAFEYIDKSIAAGWDDDTHMQSDADLTELRKDSRWAGAIARAKKVYDSGNDSRKAEIKAKKLDRQAPDWELKDVAGNTVKLSDLKGKIVILDFWATWCKPCMMAMPVLDTWMKANKSENIKVFSILVRDKNVAKAKQLFEERGFAMTLLFGNDQLMTDYGFQGIPYICAIGPDGRTRFEESGYSRNLDETLGVWLAELK